MTPTATVVIASRNRARRLERCLEALATQRTTQRFEVIVVDDASSPPLRDDPAIAGLAARTDAAWTALRLVAGAGRGPARARNVGIAGAAAPIVLFTDDDTIPSPTWLEAACTWLEQHPEAVGVEGPTWSDPFDPLFQHSVDAPAGGGWTCNIAYRREVLAQLGGFYEDFPFAHGEDLDLAYRALDVGPLGFVHDMRVEHPAAPVALRSLVREGRYAATQLEIAHRHPLRYAGGWASSHEARLVVAPARRWYGYLRARGFRQSTSGWLRLAAVVTGQTAIGAWTLLRYSR